MLLLYGSGIFFLHSPSTYTQSIPKYINMPVPWMLWTGVCSPIWTPSPTSGSLVGSEFVHLSCISQLGNGHVLEVDSVTNTRQPIREKSTSSHFVGSSCRLVEKFSNALKTPISVFLFIRYLYIVFLLGTRTL